MVWLCRAVMFAAWQWGVTGGLSGCADVCGTAGRDPGAGSMGLKGCLRGVLAEVESSVYADRKESIASMEKL